MSGPAKFRNGVKISERHGAGEWTLEKISLLVLMPLGLWVAFSALSLTGAGYDAVLDWFAAPLNAILASVTAVAFCLFASLAWKVIIEDYVHKPGTQKALISLANLIFLLLAAVSVFFIVRLALGSAPLPAGFGV